MVQVVSRLGFTLQPTPPLYLYILPLFFYVINFLTNGKSTISFKIGTIVCFIMNLKTIALPLS